MLHTKGPIFKVSELFHVVVVVIHGEILRLIALVLGANKLLAMVKDISGLCSIAVSEMFLRLMNHSIVLQLQGRFRSTYPSPH
jgi:hypothetical protein